MLSFKYPFPFLFSLIFSSVLTIAFDQTVYRVIESMGTVEACASVRGGVVLNREVVVQYETKDLSVVGMVFVCVFVSSI